MCVREREHERKRGGWRVKEGGRDVEREREREKEREAFVSVCAHTRAGGREEGRKEGREGEREGGRTCVCDVGIRDRVQYGCRNKR